ncbi:MAG: hypothetical protein J6A84_00435 [Clostridia bacterium]|nr:hypothetical protein [Clostridia bacterium]
MKPNECKKAPSAWRFLVLALLLAILLSSCQRGSDAPLSAGLKMIEGKPIYDDGVAMSTDHFTVTPGMMAYFFYHYGGQLMAQMEQSVPYDQTRSLHDQIYGDGLSFYDVIMNATLQKVSEMLIYCEAAHDAGVSLTDAQHATIDGELSNLTLDAAAKYSKTLDEYCQMLYGPLMTAADLRSVLACELLANTYSFTVKKTLEGGITQQAVQDALAHLSFRDDTPSRNISYIAIPYISGKANDAKVSEVLAALQASPSVETLSGFAAAGSIVSESNLTPDRIGIKVLSDWLFGAQRAIGDCGRVEVDGYTYVVLYRGNGLTFSEVSVRTHLYEAAYANWYNGWVEALEFGYNYDIIDGYDIDPQQS